MDEAQLAEIEKWTTIPTVRELCAEVRRQIKGRREMRAAIMRIYENIDPASVSHLDAEKALNGWHRRLHEILADDLRSW